MEIAKQLAGYTLGGADLLRRAMGKKIKAEMDAQRETFIAGCGRRAGSMPKLADTIFDAVAKFASYGFNKSHAAAYALLAYQTAWLKANHPVEFFAAAMTTECGQPGEARRLPPGDARSAASRSTRRTSTTRKAQFVVEDGAGRCRRALRAGGDQGRRRGGDRRPGRGARGQRAIPRRARPDGAAGHAA